jgi:hypothetical protein
MTKQDIAAAANAASVLRTFRDTVKTLCAVLPAGAGEKEAAVVRVLFDRVDEAINVLAPPAARAEPLAEFGRPARAPVAEGTPQRRGSDKARIREEALAAVGKHAEENGRCSVAAALQVTLEEASVPVAVPETIPVAATPDELRGRMLKLADYAVHQYAPAYLSSQGLTKFQSELDQIPALADRDALPKAQQSLAKALRTVELASSYPYEERKNVAAARLFRMLRGMLEELDGFIPKVGPVMSRFALVLNLDSKLVNPEALEHAFDTQ